MGYEQFHALVTAILLAGNFANPNATEWTIDVKALTVTAEEILNRCGFVRNHKGVSRG